MYIVCAFKGNTINNELVFFSLFMEKWIKINLFTMHEILYTSRGLLLYLIKRMLYIILPSFNKTIKNRKKLKKNIIVFLIKQWIIIIVDICECVSYAKMKT